MAIEGLTIIGESINDSVPSTKKLFEANDLDGIMALAKMQDEGGATYIDVNVGLRSPEFMADMVRQVQQVTAKPLSIDTPDYDLAAAGLKAYDPAKAGGRPPVLNSIAATRVKMFDLYKVQPFMPLLLSCESEVDGASKPNRTGQENYEAAKGLLMKAREYGIPNDHCIFDPGIAPIGSDTEGINKMVVESLRLMHEDPEFAGAHRSVGLSNFTVMLPMKRADGSPVKSPLESAFLTVAMPLGLDTVIGSVKRKYELLGPDDDALVCLKETLERDGHECIMRVMEFYM
ncbi:MAG: 5-methyltetrahydrofolate corrinoid/iron sulfur protein methyltransferase [Candidatus Hydrogenedentes bacterium]|nr:5-methyltetrahydrofolate corrinoid/iron sulfur protein methyltransferase [Candidatus Hydrogenedentota bacterium]